MRIKCLAMASAMAAMACGATGALAQDAGPVYLDSKSPFFEPVAGNEDAASVTMPELAFTPDAEDEKNYDKYFYFHRSDTDFATAYRDIVECDGYARGLASGISPVYGQGILGDALGNLLADAIYGSANRRRVRRTNMRVCMGYKGYARYGISKRLWESFNFSEGNSSIPEDERTKYLMQQALVASGPAPQVEALDQ